jgi:hypothetical protein
MWSKIFISALPSSSVVKEYGQYIYGWCGLLCLIVQHRVSVTTNRLLGAWTRQSVSSSALGQENEPCGELEGPEFDD